MVELAVVYVVGVYYLRALRHVTEHEEWYIHQRLGSRVLRIRGTCSGQVLYVVAVHPWAVYTYTYSATCASPGKIACTNMSVCVLGQTESNVPSTRSQIIRLPL